MIGMAESQFSRAIKKTYNKEGKEENSGSAYKIPVERVKMYSDAKAYRKLRKFQSIYLWIIAPLLIFLGLFYFTRFNLSTNQSQKTNSRFHLEPSPSLEDVLSYSGTSNIDHLIWEAILINESIKRKEEALTYQDSVSIIIKIRSVVVNVIKQERIAFKKLNLRFPSGENLIDVTEKTVPTNSKTMFSLNNEEVLRTKDIDELPKNATPFDKGLVEIIPYIFDKNLDFDNVASETRRIVKRAQNGILDAVLEAAKAEGYK